MKAVLRLQLAPEKNYSTPDHGGIQLRNTWHLLAKNKYLKKFPSFAIIIWGEATKHQPSNRSRSTNHIISWCYRLLIDFFHPNLKSGFNSPWRNRLNLFRIISKSSNSIKRDQISNQNCLKLIKKVKIYWLFLIKSIILIF